MAADIHGFALRKTEILKLKRRALRLGVWFKALRRIDRALVNALLKVRVDDIRSLPLTKALLSIVSTLADVKNQIPRAIGDVGFRTALKLGMIAQKWGNTSAANWGNDAPFARFLAVMHANDIAKGFTFRC